MSGSCPKLPVPTGISITVSVPSSLTTVSLINSAPDSSVITSQVITLPSKIKEPVTYTFFTEKTNPLWKENENNGLYDKCIETLKIKNS